MQRIIKFIFLASISILFVSCTCNRTKEDKIDAPKLDTTVKIHIHRYEKALFSLNKNDLQNELKRIKPEFHFFLNADLNDQANIKQLSDYINDPQMQENFVAVQNKFKDISNIERQLSCALTYFKYYFPDRCIPNVYTYIGGMDFENPIIYADSVLIIALDMYLGENYKLYTLYGLPQFMKYGMSEEYITRDCIKAMADYYCYTDLKNATCLDNMAYNGKVLYFIDAMLPETQDTIKIKYSTKQLAWCYDNESNMWAYFIHNNMLYSKDYNIYKKFFDPGPFTTAFAKTSPSRTGAWLGWRIMRKYMKTTDELNLKKLIDEKDAQKILTISKYKPKKP